MKVNHKILAILAGVMAITTFSCSTLKELGYVPEIKMQSVLPEAIDLEGITFECEYSIKNPYPLSFSIQKVSADVVFAESSYIKLSADEGISVEAMGKRLNKFRFKVPYETIFKIVRETSGKKTLPFKIAGAAYLDLSSIPLAPSSSMELPFNVAFDIPVFKPSLALSGFKLQLPGLSELKDGFVKSGKGVTTAATIAAQVLSGKALSDSIFDNVDLNVKFLFDLNIADEGSSACNWTIERCCLRSSDGLFADAVIGSKKIPAGKSKNQTIPVELTLNTLKSGKLIVQLLNGAGKNPEFLFDSKLNFPDLNYSGEIPFSYSAEIPLNKISRK